MDKEELLKMARDAGLERSGWNARESAVLEFANSILERAAVECQESELYRGSVFASRIRALKSSIDA